MNVYIYIHMHICIYIYMYIGTTATNMCIHICIYVYAYVDWSLVALICCNGPMEEPIYLRGLRFRNFQVIGGRTVFTVRGDSAKNLQWFAGD